MVTVTVTGKYDHLMPSKSHNTCRSGDISTMWRVIALSLFLLFGAACQGSPQPQIDQSAKGQTSERPAPSPPSLSQLVCSQRKLTQRFNHAAFLDRYSRHDPSELWGILADRKRSRCWPWALTAAGWLGGDTAVTYITAFIEREGKEVHLDPPTRSSVVRKATAAIGIAASTEARSSSHTQLTAAGKAKAMQFLTEATNPDWWKHSPGWLSAGDEHNLFTRAQTAALAIVWSGQPEAEDALSAFSARLEADKSPRGLDRSRLLWPALMRILGTVRKDGLLKVLMDEFDR